MPGRNMADMLSPDSLSCSPPRPLSRVGSARQSASATDLPGACASQRRFTRPRGYALSSTSARGQRSPPAASAQSRISPSGPFGSPLPASLRFCIACAGPIYVAFPLPDANSESPSRSSACTHHWENVPRGRRACRHSPGRLTFAINSISVRSPLPALFYRRRSRIIVPGSLSLARLAVPSDLLEPPK